MFNISENLTSTEKHWSDELTLPFQISLISIDVLEWPITLLGLLGMYFGIQISHPVYSILFANLFVSFAGTSLNIALFAFASFKSYARISLISNVFCNIFHCSCW